MQNKNPPRNSINLKNQLFMLMVLPALFSTSVIAGVALFLQQQDLQTQFRERGELILLYYKGLGEQTLNSNDKTQLNTFANELINEEAVRAVRIFSIQANGGNEQVLIHSGPKMLPENEGNYVTHLFARTQRFKEDLFVENADGQTFYLEFELDRNFLLLRQYESLFYIWLVSTVCLVLNLGFAQIVSVRFSEPIRRISFAIARIREGKLSTRVKSKVPLGELNELTWGINSMAESLQKAHEEMQHSVDQATADLRSTLETIEIQNIDLDFARKEAEAANRVKSQFLANISHEIRTPLNSITGFTNLLLKSSLNKTQEDQLQTIYKSSENLLAIINDILDFSKIEAGKLSLEISTVDIRHTLNEVIELLSTFAKEKKIDTQVLIDDDVPEKFLSDRLRIKQILTNLINNAIKFSEQGSLIVRVSMESSKSTQSLIKFSISDRGIGLSEKSKNKLFQPFHQSDDTNIRRFQGTGLGLTISRHLVEMLGGEIGVESSLGEGSTFWFTLPMTASKQHLFSKDNEFDNKHIQEQQAPYTHNNSNNKSNNLKPKILAVDDNPANLKLLCALMKDLNIDYDSCDGGKKAIALSKQNDYDLIFMDIQMPDLDGIETTRQIREFDKRFSKSRAIIALTAHAFDNEKQSLLNEGFNHCLTKPIDVDLLVKTITHWTGFNPDDCELETEKTQLYINEFRSIDVNEGLRLSGNKADLANEMLEMLTSNLLKDWRNIEKYFRDQDFQALLEKVHYIHGACRYCGVPLLRTAIVELETLLKKQNYDSLDKVLNKVEKEIFALLEAYEASEKPIHKIS